MMLVMAVLSSTSLLARQRDTVIVGEGYHFVGKWPEGKGALYSNEGGLVLGQFTKARPQGECVCYRPNGELYWGQFKNGKATGIGKLYRDNGIVLCGEFKNGRYHGIDTLYRSNGTTLIGRFKNGKLKAKIDADWVVGEKPAYPRVDIRFRQEAFLNDLENMWEERNLAIVRNLGFVHPKFQGGGVDDFALWVNSQVVYPIRDRSNREERTVIVEFTVLKDGSVTDVHAVFGSDPVLNEAAVEAVAKSPKWTPGEQNGEPKNVRMSVAVVFSLE